MTDVVYWVNGGLEDWSYAAGWENTIDGFNSVVQCSPKNVDYPGHHTRTDRSNIRNIMFLVEAGPKEPANSQYGNKKSIRDKHSPKFGYMARIIRLSFALVDLT